MKRSVIALAAALAWAACSMPDFKPLEPGDEVPAFTAATLDGGEFESAELAGTPYLLNIWATWCAPCRHEMPELQQLHEAFSGQNFQVVGVSVDDRGSRETIKEFLAEVGVTFPIYHDPSWEIQDTYGLLGLPGSFLMDAEGRLVRKWMGPFKPMDEDVLEDVRRLVGAEAAEQP